MSYCRHALRLRACSRSAPAVRLALVRRPLSSTTIPETQARVSARSRVTEPEAQGAGAAGKGGVPSAGTGSGKGGEASPEEVEAAMKRLSEK